MNNEEEAAEWLKGNKSNAKKFNWINDNDSVLCAQADAASTQQAYWIIKAGAKGLLTESIDEIKTEVELKETVKKMSKEECLKVLKETGVEFKDVPKPMPEWKHPSAEYRAVDKGGDLYEFSNYPKLSNGNFYGGGVCYIDSGYEYTCKVEEREAKKSLEELTKDDFIKLAGMWCWRKDSCIPFQITQNTRLESGTNIYKDHLPAYVLSPYGSKPREKWEPALKILGVE